MQCMLGATTAVGAASGTRSWLAAKKIEWLTPARMRRVTIALFAVAILVAGLIPGSTPPPTAGHHAQQQTAQSSPDQTR